MNITGATKLYLNVRDGGDGTAWDHADWLNPTLSNGGKTVALATLPWRSATAGWGSTTINKSVSGAPLMVAGKTYETGIGTHANSIIEYDLPAGYTRFRATLGLDQAAAGQNTGGTLRGLVFTKSPFLPAPADSVQVAGALQALGLLVPLREANKRAGLTIEDLWTGRKTTGYYGEFAPYIRRHGAGFYRISSRRK